MLRVLVPKEAPSIKQVHPGKGESDEARPSKQASMSEMGLVSGCWRGRSRLTSDPAGTRQDEDVMESPLLRCVG